MSCRGQGQNTASKCLSEFIITDFNFEGSPDRRQSGFCCSLSSFFKSHFYYYVLLSCQRRSAEKHKILFISQWKCFTGNELTSKDCKEAEHDGIEETKAYGQGVLMNDCRHDEHREHGSCSEFPFWQLQGSETKLRKSLAHSWSVCVNRITVLVLFRFTPLTQRKSL